MALLSDSWLFDTFTISIALVAVFLTWIKWCHGYWQRKGVSVPPTTFILGNMKKFFQDTSPGDFFLDFYTYFRDLNKPYGGVYMLFKPLFVVVEPELIKNIMQNGFDHFVDRGVYFNEEDDPLSAHLFSLEGLKWKNLRAKLTPTFTSGKMKMMFDTLVKCGDQLTLETGKFVGKESVDIKDILGRFTADVIGNCAFGIDCNSLKDPNNEFTKHFKLVFVFSFWENMKSLLGFVAPSVAKKLGMKAIKSNISNFFMRVVKETVQYREENNVYRKDFMHLLLQLKNRGKLTDDGGIFKEEGDSEEVTLTMNELAAQAFVFFLAGFETSSTTMTFCLFELASNPEIQEKVRQELDEVLEKHGNKLTYDALMDMHYMEKAINETLRKYPPLPILNRVCTKDYPIPGTNTVIEKGMQVAIPILGLHRDEKYYPDPEKFDPERFDEENKRNRHPYTFLPFGEGPRICIGLRFGMMQTKVGLAVLLKNFKFSVSPKTALPLQLDPTSFIMMAKGGMWLDVSEV